MPSFLIALKSGFIRVARSRLRQGLGAAMMLFLLISLGLQAATPARAQFLPGMENIEGEVASESFIPVFRRGNLELAPIFLDGKMLGLASGYVSLRLRDESLTNAEKINAANRAYLIHGKLQKYLQAMSLYTRKLASNGGITDLNEQEKILREQLSVSAVRGANGSYVALTFPAQRKPEAIFTVAKSDIDNLRFASSDPLQIATLVAVQTRADLISAWRERQPPALLKAFTRAAYVFAGLVLASFLLVLLQRRLKRLQQHFSSQLAVELRASVATTHPESNVAPTEKGLSFVKATLRTIDTASNAPAPWG